MAASSPRRTLIEWLSANKWKVLIASLLIPICLVAVLTLIDIVQVLVIGLPEWIDVDMGELSPSAPQEAYLEPRADNGYSCIRHVYRYHGQKGQTLRVLVTPDENLHVGIEIWLDTGGELAYTPPDTQVTPGVPAELEVEIPETGVYTIIVTGSDPGYYQISIEASP
jgi:hypothetical protein